MLVPDLRLRPLVARARRLPHRPAAGRYLTQGELVLDRCPDVTAGDVRWALLADTVFPYPTYAEALRKVGDQYNRTRLTPFRARMLKTWLKWFR